MQASCFYWLCWSHTLSALPLSSPAGISPAGAEALSQVDGSRHSSTEPPCLLTPLIHLYTLYTDQEGRGQIKNDHFPCVITPTHEFVAVSFVEFVFLLAWIWFWSSLSCPPPSSTPPPSYSSLIPPYPHPHSASHPQSLPLFKVPYIRSPLREKTGVILGIHVSLSFFFLLCSFFCLSPFLVGRFSTKNYQSRMNPWGIWPFFAASLDFFKSKKKEWKKNQIPLLCQFIFHSSCSVFLFFPFPKSCPCISLSDSHSPPFS